MGKIKEWVKNNPKEFYILLVIIAVSAYLRLYRIGEYMTFLGDEGRDAIIVRRLLVDFDPILIGPVTSIGNMYLGPLYYYLMAPALLIAGLNPVGPAIQIALMGIATVFLVWYIAREWFPTSPRLRGTSGINIAALVAGGLYAISPTIINFSRSSWNPNIMPFFSLLSIYGVWRVWKYKQYKWLIVLGVSFAFIMQSHYLGLLLLPTLFLFIFLSYLKTKDKKIIRNSVYGIVIFLLLMSPLVIFDAIHGWNNFGAMAKFFTERQTTVSVKPWKAIPNVWPLWVSFNESLIGARNQMLGMISALVLGLGLVYKAFKNRKSISPYLVLFVWLGAALIGLGVYKQHIYDHYFGFFFAAPYILAGALVQETMGKAKKAGKWMMGVGLILIIWFSIQNSPLKSPPNRQAQRAKDVANFIIDQAGDEEFNMAVVADRNYEDGYQYFVEKVGAKVVEIDAQRVDETITDQLYVVCEKPHDECDPTHSPKAEIVNFGWTDVVDTWQVSGVTVFKLGHSDKNN